MRRGKKIAAIVIRLLNLSIRVWTMVLGVEDDWRLLEGKGAIVPRRK